MASGMLKFELFSPGNDLPVAGSAFCSFAAMLTDTGSLQLSFLTGLQEMRKSLKENMVMSLELGREAYPACWPACGWTEVHMPLFCGKPF